MSSKLDPFSDAIFVFCNTKRDKIKLLHLFRSRNNLSYSEQIIPTFYACPFISHN
jgi:hypothetical protein